MRTTEIVAEQMISSDIISLADVNFVTWHACKCQI